MSNLILDVQDLTVQFPAHRESKLAINHISFSLERGTTLGIVGESGSGKSVTSTAILRLIPKPGEITSGLIYFNEIDGGTKFELLGLPEEQMRSLRGRKIAMIFQEPMSALNPVYTIGYQIIEAIKLHQSVTADQSTNQAIALLQEVKLLPSDEQLEAEYLENNTKQISAKEYLKYNKEAILKRYPHELSGGQLQRVMIAMAISCQPALLIADEPTTALDVTVQAGILDLLKSISVQRGMSMLFISHDLGVINRVADSIMVMYQGKIVEQGTKDQILTQPKHPYTKGLISCRPRLDIQPEKLSTVADFMTVKSSNGQIIQKSPPPQKIISAQEEFERLIDLQQREAILIVKNLQVEYRKKGFLQSKIFKAVDDVSFEVKKGETLGLVGESGCGKSTLARAIMRLIPISAGEIYFLGYKISEFSSEKMRSIRSHMQIVFQNPYNSLNPRLSIGQAILEPLLIHQAKMKGNRQKVEYLLERVGLDPNWQNRYPHELSGGQRQRVCIARALALNPQFIVCDESVSALDVSVQAEVLNLLKELQRDWDLTYIFISHDLSVVRFMSDRIIVMNKGKFVESGTAREILTSPKQDYTKSLIASIPR
jgi:peptide/nickel transport system ATP-binding protein